MKTLAQIIESIEAFAPPSLAPFDYVGLLQGDERQSITKIGLTLDYSLLALKRAHEMGCDLLITHHGPTEIHYPLIGNNLEKITFANANKLAVYRCHLNLDFCEGGVIDTLCQLLKLPAKKQKTRYQNHQLTGGVNLIEKKMNLEELLARIKHIRSLPIRSAGRQKETFSRIAITSGQGFIAEFFDQLLPDVYIAGEFEQEAVKYAEDLGVMLIELGHHQSEQTTLPFIANRLTEKLSIPVHAIEVPDTIEVIPHNM